jgi:hypothetical protein
MPIIPALGRLRYEDQELKINLGAWLSRAASRRFHQEKYPHFYLLKI